MAEPQQVGGSTEPVPQEVRPNKDKALRGLAQPSCVLLWGLHQELWKMGDAVAWAAHSPNSSAVEATLSSCLSGAVEGIPSLTILLCAPSTALPWDVWAHPQHW